MNKKILLLVIFLTTLTCSAKTEKSIPEQRLEGWAGNPDNPNENPQHFFYGTFLARASQNSIKKKNVRMMQNSCIEANTLQAKGNLLNKIISETVMLSSAQPEETEMLKKILIKEYKNKDNEIKAKSCYPVAKPSHEEPDSEWKECECVFYLYIKGGKDAIIARAIEIEND